jgi:muramoyltetrapeptide carboxypeptidase LdcA involved in peptidoglycan recycling
MIYPEKLKIGDVIGVTAPSLGVNNQKDNLRVNNAIKNLKEKGFIIKETANVRTCKDGRSSSGKQRAKEFLELWNDEDVKSIICLEGGDFAVEMLDELDLNSLKTNSPKWIQGYSDITNLGYVITLNLDIATIYGPNFKSFGMKNLHISHENSLRLMGKEEFIQNSYEKYEEFNGWDDENSTGIEDAYEEFELTAPVKWINLNNESEIEFSGRCIGGCLDCIKDLIGTKYDKVKEYVQKYKNDGIVWFLECFESSTPGLLRTLLQFKNSGYFENCKGIIFGRPLMIREDFGYSYELAIKDAFKDLNIPIIIDADIRTFSTSTSNRKWSNFRSKIKRWKRFNKEYI